MLQIDHLERWFSCALDMLNIGRMTHGVTDEWWCISDWSNIEWMTDMYASRASASNTSESFGIGRLVVETWKLDNSTCPPWTKDTRMCNPKEIMRTHAHSQLVIMRTHAVQGAMLPMELRKWLEGQIRLYTTAICWRIWKQMVANWSMPDFQPFSLDTIYTETSIQLRTDKFNNLEAAVSCFNLFLIWSWIYGFAWFSPPYKTCQLFYASVYLKSQPGQHWTFGSCCMFEQHQMYVCLATWSGEHLMG